MSESQSTGRSVAAVVAAVVGCMLIACCAVATLLFSWCQTAMVGPGTEYIAAQKAHVTVTEFLAHLEKGDVEAARALGTEALRAEWPADRLRALADRMAERLGPRRLGGVGPLPMSEPSKDGDSRYTLRERFEKGEALIEYRVVDVAYGTSRIAAISITSDLLDD